MIRQGSLWGMSPKTAKKIIDMTLAPADSGTAVTSSSRLSSDWKNLTIIGCALAAVLVGLCSWITLDLNSFVVTGKPTFWSWIVTANGSVRFSVAEAFGNLARSLAIFLSVVIALEIAIVLYVHAGIERFSQETLEALSKQTADPNKK